MPVNLDAKTLITFAIKDFESAWDSLAKDATAAGRGNFMFGDVAMTLLELACRTCKSDPTGATQAALTDALRRSESRYFHDLPGVVWTPGQRTLGDFQFPSLAAGPPPTAHRHVLAAIFNLVRNGQAHQYQQTGATLSDGKGFTISLTGPHPGYLLAHANSPAARGDHLVASEDALHGLELKVRTDVLFTDIRDAVRTAGLDVGPLTIQHLSATLPFDTAALRSSLQVMNGGIRVPVNPLQTLMNATSSVPTGIPGPGRP